VLTDALHLPFNVLNLSGFSAVLQPPEMRAILQNCSDI